MKTRPDQVANRLAVWVLCAGCALGTSAASMWPGSAAAGPPTEASNQPQPTADPVPAEPPHLLLISGLRQRGEAELALAYLRYLETRQHPPLPAAVKAELPRWRAQVSVDLALHPRQLAEVERRVQEVLSQFSESAFRREQARLHLEYGELLALLAAEVRVPALRQRLTGQAREQLRQAERLWADLDREATSPSDSAKLFHGAALLLQTRLLDVDERATGEIWQAALNQFDKLGRLQPPTPLTFLAQAWQVRCWLGVDDRKAEEWYRRLNQDRRPDAQAAQRLGRYFRLTDAWRRRLEPGRYQKAAFRQEAERWLAEAHFHSAPFEVLYLRFCLATSYADELLAMEDKERLAPPAEALLERALAEYEQVYRGFGPFAQLADERRLALLARTGRADVEPDRLRSASEALLAARLAWMQLQEAITAQPPAAKPSGSTASAPAASAPSAPQMSAPSPTVVALADRLQRLLDRGLALCEVPGGEVWTALQRLRFESLAQRGEWPRAVEVCLLLWRHAEEMEVRQAAAVEALRQMARLPQRGGPQRLALANEVLATLPQSPAADVAREVVGVAHLEQHRFTEAAEVLLQVSAQSPRQAACQYYAALALWQQHVAFCQQQKQPLGTASAAQKRALELLPAALARLEAQPSEAQLAVAARVDYAQILYLLERPAEAHQQLEPLLRRLEVAPAGGSQGTGGGTSSAATIPPALMPRILELALRLAVQDSANAGTAALRVVNILKRHGGGDPGAYEGLLRELGRQLQTQLRAGQQQGPATAAQVQKLRENFIQLLAQVEATPQPSTDALLWVASMYQALGQADQAAARYEKCLAVTPLAAGQSTAIRLSAVIAFREAAQTATNPAERQRWLAAAERHLQMLRSDAALQRHPLVVRESILLQQGAGAYATAIERWEQFRLSLEPHVASRPGLKDLVDEARYYQFLAECDLARQTTDPAARRLAWQRAAQSYLLAERIGFGSSEWRERFETFLAKPEQADLRQAIEKLREGLP